MKLKKIEIIGFKSFADKTKLDFHEGITAIVGPNGCGKSNISDAFRWVLGEQSAKSMRGTKMPDVIFAGATHRKPLNYAEVSITLNDIKGELPIAYDEVTVTRRLHRNGESEYFINRQNVRLKDVQALFLDSGMGKDAYSIFEQGKIDQVINLSPLERRYIFEEAAGILRFLQRKKEALRRLEQTELNVSRVKDIHLEVEKQIIILEDQAEKALEYRSNKETLDKLEKGLLVTKWESLENKINEVRVKGEAQDGHVASSNSQIETFLGQITESKLELAEAEKALRIRAEEVYSVKSSKEIKAKEKQSNQERLKDLIAKEKRWQDELGAMAGRRQARADERKTHQNQKAATEKRLDAHLAVVNERRSTVKSLEESLHKARDKQQAHQRELFKLTQAESQCESEIRQTKIRLESVQERQSRIQERKERLKIATGEAEALSVVQKKQVEEAVGSLEIEKERFSSMDNKLSEIATELERGHEKLDTLQEQIGENRARQKALQRLREDMEGFSAGGKKLLQEAAVKSSPFYGKIGGLYEHLTPEKGAEGALAAVMKPYAQTLVVETEEDFEAVLGYVKKNKIKDVSLLCLDTIRKIKGVKGLKPSEGLAPLTLSVIENELSRHFLQGAYTSKIRQEPLEAIRENGGVELWMGDGVFIDRRSVFFYSSQGENNVFLREAELKDLEKKLHDGETERGQLETVIHSIQQKRQQLQNERADLDKAIRKSEMKLVELNFAMQKSTADLERMRQEDKQLSFEWQSVVKMMEELSVSLVELDKRHKQAKGFAAEAQKEAEKLNGDLQKLVADAREKGIDLREKENILQQLTEEQRKIDHTLHVLEVKDLESDQQKKRLEEEIELGQAQQAQFQVKGSEVEKLLKDVEHALANAVSACGDLEQQVALKRKALDQLESKLNEKRQTLKKHEGERHQVGIQAAQLESTRQSLENELQERHHLTLSEARKISGSLGLTPEQLDKQAKQLRQKIDDAGDINMTSIEECEKHKTRYRFLNQQIDDLSMSKDELVAIIADLDGESRKIFQETFQQIRTNFRKNFEVLFNGGEADLQFTESSDILEAGIEIIAKPPGKQMRSINLLSGGEKCLTALALLFAVFEVRPSPFCILDEIDAPLDDSNVERFVNIVKQYTETCQFIIITHNKRTMAIADVICGVSMEEKGVSKLISIDFSKNAMPEMATL